MILLLALIASLQFSTDSANQLIGTWLNQEPSTGGVTQIVITTESGALRAHVWGACEPTDCDWGVAELTLKESAATAIFDVGPIATTVYFVRLPNDKLLAVHKAEYRDDQSYKDQDHAELFVREKLDPNDESARTLLKKVSAAYSNLTTAEFEFQVTSQESDQATATHSKSLTHLLISSTGKLREETTGSGERRIHISDGKSLWTYFPESDQYTVYLTGKQRNSIVDRYRSIDQVRGSATITGSEHIDNANCTVIKIERPGSVRSLWIDSKTNFILKDDSTTTLSTPGDLTTTNWVLTFSVARVLPRVDEQLFSFDPHKVQAKPREELQREERVHSIGTPAPDFTLFDLENKPFRLSQLKGKAVLMDFWATWCVPCRSALPTVELLHRDFKDKGLIVMGVDNEEPKDQAAFLEKFGYTFHSMVDPTEQVKNLYRVGGIPTTVLIDKEGVIQVYELGGSSYASLREALLKMGIF